MSKRGNPQMQRGAPSVNPAGRGAPFARAIVDKARATAAPGTTGVVAHGGYLSQGEGSSRLTSSRKWIEYADAYAIPAVWICLQLRSALLESIKWSLTPNPAGGSDADLGVDLVEQGLLNARLAKPWRVIVRKTGMSFFDGFALHATALGRRKDGRIVYTDIAYRPPSTIERWLRPSELAPFDTAVQRARESQQEIPIPLAECFHVADDKITESPDGGGGSLRQVIERIRRVGLYERLEGSELFSSMGGTPIVRAPLEEIVAGVADDDRTAVITAATASQRSAVTHRIKTPELPQWLMLDSSTYKGANPDSISSINKWGIEILKGDLQGLPEIRKVISDLHLDIARMLGVEFAFMGGGDSKGTYDSVESKTNLFMDALQGSVDAIALHADTQLIRRLIAANGLDPDTAAPTLVAAPVSSGDVEKTARTLGLINMAGLPAGHPARKALFDQLRLPWQEEDSLAQLMTPRRTPEVRADQDPADVVDPDVEPEKEPA